jgi:hypothetical protein
MDLFPIFSNLRTEEHRLRQACVLLMRRTCNLSALTHASNYRPCRVFASTFSPLLLTALSMQGSNDLAHWLDLRRHLHDSTIRLPGQYGSWPISGPAASMPFRAFRLLLLGPTQSNSSPWAFCLSHWELYGYFYKLSSSVPAAANEAVPQRVAAAAETGPGAERRAAGAGGEGEVQGATPRNVA